MRKKTLLCSFLLGLLVTLMAAGSVFAAGFALYEGSARGNVLGAGLTATADDPSAIFFNPAGITQLKGMQMMVGLTAINPALDVVTGSTSTSMEDNWFFPPHAYFTQQINDKLFWGIGLFSRFGLGTEFSETWPGRYNSYEAMIQSVELNPNIAYKITDSISLAAGVSVMWFDVSLKRKLPVAPSDIDFELSGDSFGYGFNLAAHYKPIDWFSAGISYRSRVKQDISGDVTVSRSVVVPGVANITSMGGDAEIDLPSMVFAGVNFKPIKTVSVGLGVYWTEWSSYDQLEVTFGQPFGAPPASVSRTKKDWDDTFRYMIGVEWAMTDTMDLRFGYAYDETPVPDETIAYELPDSDRQMFSIGFGYHRDKWLVDLSYTYILFDDRDIAGRAADGVATGKVENGDAHLIGLSFGYKF